MILTPEQVRTVFDRFAQHNPHPTTELIYHSHFELLVAVMLSAQATDVGVNRITPRLFARANTPQAIVQLGVSGLDQLIQTINYHPTKARHIHRTSELLIERHQGQVPLQREALEALPGVGRKTANVVLNVATGAATFPVDTHVFRVSNRTGLAPGATPLAVENTLHQRVPAAYQTRAHHWLVLHGRYVCRARQPRCDTCLIRDVCCQHGVLDSSQ